jgi:hypothetical protein
MATQRLAFAAIAVMCMVPAGGLLLLGACVDEAPSDCSSHFNCVAGTDGGRDAGARTLDATMEDAGHDPGDAGEAGRDGGEAGQVLDAANDTWDGFDGFVCDPSNSPHDAPCVVDEAYGVFVAPAANGGSDTGGDGSRARPYATIAHALANVGAKTRVYACDGKYAEGVALSSAVSLYGGLACPNDDAGSAWSYVGGQAQFMGPQNQVALMVSGIIRAISIEDMSFSAPSASGKDSDGDGLSSIAALVNASTATLRRCTLTAGSGDQGNDGTSGSNYSGATAQDGNANDGGSGGAGATATCADGTSSTGGNGGDATQSTATDGGDGHANPMPQTNPGMRLDGLGGSGGFGCTPGDKGSYGTASAAGTAATTLGTLTAVGWMPTAGSVGHAGYPAQGGGGGGGLAQATLPLGSTGGGAGGCGGAGGSGGRGGGASIALGCVASNVELEACTLVTSNGGGGGKGGDGQAGQGGGKPGVPTLVGGCAGAYGGNGAGGSGGAGGTGGISVCVVYQGGGPPTGTPSCAGGDAGQAGNGGAGGAGGSNAFGVGPNGADGGPGLAGSVAPSLLSR